MYRFPGGVAINKHATNLTENVLEQDGQWAHNDTHLKTRQNVTALHTHELGNMHTIWNQTILVIMHYKHQCWNAYQKLKSQMQEPFSQKSIYCGVDCREKTKVQLRSKSTPQTLERQLPSTGLVQQIAKMAIHHSLWCLDACFSMTSTVSAWQDLSSYSFQSK